MILELLIENLKCSTLPNYMLLEKEKIIQLLTKLRLNLPDEIKNKIKKEKVNKGTYLIRSGQIASKIWCTESGIAHSFYQKGHLKLTENFSFPNEIFCVYSSMVRKIPSILSIQLLTDSVVWYMDWNEFRNITQELPALFEIERMLLACWIQNSLERSLNRFITVEEQYLLLIKRQPILIEQIPSVYLANYLGTAPETISRVRAKIKDGTDIPNISPLEYIFSKRKTNSKKN